MTRHKSHKNKRSEFDVLIVGSGLVGSSLACALEPAIKDHGLNVALVETCDLNEPRKRPPSFDARASALSYGTRRIYDELNLWHFVELEATPILDVHVSDKGHFGITRLNYADEKVPALGYVVENHILGEALLDRLQAHNKQGLLTVFSPDQVKKLTPVSGGMTVELSSASVSASLVVLADGGRSGLMDQLGIGREKTTYAQHGLIANLTMDRPHKGVAYERFAGKGPMALLPLKGNRYALVWTVSDDEITDIQSLDNDAFLQLIQERFGYRAGRFLEVGKRDIYPLSMTLAKEQVRPGLVVLGNAAHAIHPVAGQGYNLAIRDTLALANNIQESLQTGQKVGNLTRLLSYQEDQHQDQAVTTVFCDVLVKLFARQDLPSVLVRNIGLVGLDAMKPVKNRFVRKAMGL
ncbi:hypothetical protein ACH42_12475 [Endozoicomonas sp. (ex Bugula neritina AB1)]|nr:hypothetical protein ACH42_12475 [Endozoicomonas sp. (ex Bugula neritina AB1)]